MWFEMGWRDWREWSGVGERRWATTPNEGVQPSKTVWDLLQLLIVPVILVVVSLWWSASQDTRDKSIAEQVRQDTTLDDYIQRLGDLMLSKKLKSSKQHDAVRSVARTVTLTTLRRLDGERKGELLRFLYEVELLYEQVDQPPMVDLWDADLTAAELEGAMLSGADLSDVTLVAATLIRAKLAAANLGSADFSRANLTEADLTGADLTAAHLKGASLSRADLSNASLAHADLRDADLTNANLTDADLSQSDLRGASFRGANLTRVKGLTKRGAILRVADVSGAKGLPETIP